MGDLGVAATERILDDLREKVKQHHIKEPMECRQLLIDSIKEQMDVGKLLTALRRRHPSSSLWESTASERRPPSESWPPNLRLRERRCWLREPIRSGPLRGSS